MMCECACKTCGTKFRSQKKDSIICYECALTSLIGNGAPEEGDFNTALIASGEMSDYDVRLIQADLESIDHSGEEAALRRMFEDYDDADGRYDYLDEREEDE